MSFIVNQYISTRARFRTSSDYIPKIMVFNERPGDFETQIDMTIDSSSVNFNMGLQYRNIDVRIGINSICDDNICVSHLYDIIIELLKPQLIGEYHRKYNEIFRDNMNHDMRVQKEKIDKINSDLSNDILHGLFYGNVHSDSDDKRKGDCFRSISEFIMSTLKRTKLPYKINILTEIKKVERIVDTPKYIDTVRIVDKVVEKVKYKYTDITRDKCAICLENESNSLFKCGHLCLCKECGDSGKIDKCPICRDKSKFYTIFGI